LAGVLFDAYPSAVHRAARLTQLQRRGHADVKAALSQAEAFLVGLERIAGDLQQRLIGLQRQPGVGDAGDQTDLRAALGGLAGEELVQRLVTQAAQTTEQIELPGHTEGSTVLAADRRLAAHAEIA